MIEEGRDCAAVVTQGAVDGDADSQVTQAELERLFLSSRRRTATTHERSKRS